MELKQIGTSIDQFETEDGVFFVDNFTDKEYEIVDGKLVVRR